MLGKPLIEGASDPADLSRRLFHAPMVVVAHGTQADPILCYGNHAALELWEMSWEQLTSTPSRLTAEPVERKDRERLLSEARRNGFICNYRGIRISSTGKRFWIENATIWNWTDEQGTAAGQAAMFSTWKPLEPD